MIFVVISRRLINLEKIANQAEVSCIQFLSPLLRTLQLIRILIDSLYLRIIVNQTFEICKYKQSIQVAAKWRRGRNSVLIFADGHKC